MTRTQNYRWMQRIYKLLRDPETRVALRHFKPELAGLAYAETQTMFIDPRKDLVCTIVHECLHLLLPDTPLDADNGNCSKKVQRLERDITNSMSDRQWSTLTCRIGNKLW